ncbi:MAG TPA: DUF502 domain-containing protein [Arenicellales bacterium]|nr:DUF502 domain-containing protein [Arenicellales bacterium]
MNINQEMLSRIWRTFLSGLVAVLPLAITLYLIYWLGRLAEAAFGGFARLILPDGWYVPGFGVLLAALAIFAIGVFMQQVVFSRLVEIAEELLSKIPVVKTVYTAVRDTIDFISRASQRRDLKRVVLVEVQENVHIIGFVTDDEAGQVLPELVERAGEQGAGPLVSVYLPMSYMVGGYTVYLPSDRLIPLDISIEEAMRVALTAGVNRPRRAGRPGNDSTDPTGERESG